MYDDLGDLTQRMTGILYLKKAPDRFRYTLKTIFI